MKQAIIGLRKRETYDELINDLDHDLIKNYPDRRASEIENSSYMSQLRGGFEEMLLQNDNLMKERQKEVILHDEAGKANVGRHELVIDEGRWRPHVAPEPAERFYTPERLPPAPPPELPINSPNRYVYPALAQADPRFAQALQQDLDAQNVLKYPVGQPVAYAPGRPEIQVSATRSRERESRKARDRNQPLIEEVEAEVFHISTPRTRSGRKGKNKLAHDVDPDVEEAHAIAIDDEEMHQQTQTSLRERSVAMVRMMLEEAQHTSIDDFMSGRGDKRREEGANPKPAQPKAKTTAWTKAPPEKPKHTPASASTDIPPQPKASPKKEAKAKAAPEPKASPEPKRSPGRPKAQAKPEAEPQETETKSKPIPVKKNAPKKTEQKGTAKVFHDTFDEWKKNSNKGSLIDQYNLRKIGTYLATKNDIKSITVKQLIEKILDNDHKNKK